MKSIRGLFTIGLLLVCGMANATISEEMVGALAVTQKPYIAGGSIDWNANHTGSSMAALFTGYGRVTYNYGYVRSLLTVDGTKTTETILETYQRNIWGNAKIYKTDPVVVPGSTASGKTLKYQLKLKMYILDNNSKITDLLTAYSAVWAKPPSSVNIIKPRINIGN